MTHDAPAETGDLVAAARMADERRERIASAVAELTEKNAPGASADLAAADARLTEAAALAEYFDRIGGLKRCFTAR